MDRVLEDAARAPFEQHSAALVRFVHRAGHIRITSRRGARRAIAAAIILWSDFSSPPGFFYNAAPM
jgi:hypothetical protein